MDYQKYRFLKIEIEDKVATVTINRPDELNAVSMDVHRELEDIWVDLDRDEDVYVIILTGAGRAFVAGGDLKAMAQRTPEEARRHATAVPGKARRLLNGILETQKPIISAVNGDAIGLGATLALFCDISVMNKDARIGDPHVRVGLVCGDGGAIIWPLLLGPALAKEYLMRGLVITGEEAKKINLVNHAVPADEVLSTARSIAKELRHLPAWSIRYTKSTINLQLKQQFNLMMDAAIGLEAVTMFGPNYREAIAAYAEKRKPVFVDE